MGVIVPSRRLELRLSREHGYRVILGLDEVGVAPSSGPVVACALAMPLDKKPIPGVRDSKTLSAAQRERLAKKILRRATTVGLGAASVREIDRLNIYYATVLAMKRAVTRAGAHDFVIVDGRHIRGFEEHAGPYRAVIDGDALCYVVSCASIVAKVTRDRLMANLVDALSGLRLGAQRGLRHGRPPRRHGGAGRHPAPPTIVHHDQAHPRGRADLLRPLRGGRRLDPIAIPIEIGSDPVLEVAVPV